MDIIDNICKKLNIEKIRSNISPIDNIKITEDIIDSNSIIISTIKENINKSKYNNPEIVKEYIKKHWEDNDYYLQFIAERLEYAYKDKDKKEVDSSVEISSSEMYPFFTRWFKDYYPGVPVPTAAQFKSDMCMDGRLNVQPKKGVWLGIKMKNIVPDLAGGMKL